MKRWSLLVLLVGLIGILPIFRMEIAGAQADCSRSPMQRLAVGDRARVVNSPAEDPLHTRPRSGLNSGYTGELVNGDIVTIIDGPVCSNDYRFWMVSGAGESGWVRDGRDDQLWLEPVGTNAPSSDEGADDHQRFQLKAGEELEIKSQSDGRGRTLTTIEGGDIVTMIELIEDDDIVIAKVSYGSHTGWVLFQINGEDLFRSVG